MRIGSALRALPVVAVVASIVAVAMHYNGFGPAGPPQPRLDPAFDVRKDGLRPERAADGMQIVAVRPGGTVIPLLWLYGYEEKYRHSFLLRKPLTLEAGTIIRGVKPPASLLLLPVSSSGTR